MEPTQPPTQGLVQSPPEINIPRPKSNYFKIILLLILGIISIGLIIFLCFQNQQLKIRVLNQQISPTIKAPSPTIKVPPPTSKTVSAVPILSDGITNWKVYEDKNLGFKVKYPNSWNTIPFQGEWEPGAWSILAYSPDSKTSIIKGEVVGVVESQSTSFMVTVYNKSQVTVEDLENLAFKKNSKKTKQTINQIKGLLILNEDKANTIEKLFIFEKEDYTFVIQLLWRKEKLEEEENLEQILATFEFVDKQCPIGAICD